MNGNSESSRVMQLPVLGVMTTFATNSPAVAAAIYETFGAWAALTASNDLVSPSTATVRIIEHDRPLTATAASSFYHHVPDRTRLLVIADDSIGVADTVRLESVAYIAPGLISNRTEFIDGLLEPLTLFLLGALDRQPLHAAAIARGRVAIVLAGPSGAGKSTLTYAARQCGFTMLADEPVYVQLEPTLRVWGRRSRVHLTTDARAHFPELRDVAPTALPTGKSKIVIESNDHEPRYAEQVGLCILRRNAGAQAELERLSPQQAVAQLTAHLDPGYELFADTIGERIARIAERGAWSLSITDSPADALPLLERVAAALETSD